MLKLLHLTIFVPISLLIFLGGSVTTVRAQDAECYMVSPSGKTINLSNLCGNKSVQAAKPQFSAEQEAQKHCPDDTVVWVNTNSGVYHFKGQRWYGNTNQGAYECRKEADLEGDRATENGQ